MDSFPARPTTPVDLRSPAGTIKVLRQGAAVTIDLDPKVLASTAFLKGDKGDPGRQGNPGQQGTPTTVNGKTGQAITLTATDVGAWNDAAVAPQSKKINFRQKTFNMADYGAIPNVDDAPSAAANLAALYAAAADLIASPAGTGTLLIPNERFYLRDQFNKPYPNGVAVIGAGFNSTLFFSNSVGANGLVVHAAASGGNYFSRISVANLMIFARNCANLSTGRLLSVRGTGISGGLNAEDIFINSDPSAVAANYMTIVNGGTGQIKNVAIEGSQGSYGTAGIGFSLYSDVLSTDVSLIACNVNRVGTAYNMVGGSAGNSSLTYTLEGVNMFDCIAVGVQQGVVASAPNYRSPLFNFRGGHINAQQYAFNLNNLGTIRIENAQPQLDINNNPQALVYAQNVSNLRIAGCQFFMVDQLGSGKTQPVVPCIVAGSGCDNWQIINNFAGNFQPIAPLFLNQTSSGSSMYAGGNIKPGRGSNPVISGPYTDMGYNLGN